jgi:hypothetical protein
MNSAPAELLQLLTIAALQPSSATVELQFGRLQVRCSHRGTCRTQKEKAALPERVRQCGLFFSRSVSAYWMNQRPIFSIGLFARLHAKKRVFTF